MKTFVSILSAAALALATTAWAAPEGETLVATAAKLAGSFTTVYALLMAMGDNEAAPASFSAADVCTLTTVQAETIKALMAGGNASCSYNVTLDAVLAT